MSETAQVAIQRVTDTLYAPVRYTGSGTPEGTVTSETGWLYRDTATGELWVKATGSGNTGWATAIFSTGASGTCALPTIDGSAGQTSFVHGLGAFPNLVTVQLECTSTDIGYAPGSILNLECAIDVLGNPAFYQSIELLAVRMRKTDATTTAVYLPQATTGVFTQIVPGFWRFNISAAIF